MNRDAKDRPNPEASSGINPAHQDGEAAVSKLASDPAESGIRFIPVEWISHEELCRMYPAAHNPAKNI